MFINRDGTDFGRILEFLRMGVADYAAVNSHKGSRV